MKIQRIKSSVVAVLLALGAASSQASVLINEGFNSVAGLAGAGWVMSNASAGGSTGWFQGDVGIFTAQAGADDSYIAANYNNAASGSPIQNWLITPLFTFSQYARLDFWTRTDGSGFADRLTVRYNATGSTNLGDFTSTVLSINPSEQAGGYPSAWTAFSALLGNNDGGTGRLAFVYDVSDSDIANYIGIDSVSVQAVPEPASLALVGLALAGAAFGSRRSSRKHVA